MEVAREAKLTQEKMDNMLKLLQQQDKVSPQEMKDVVEHRLKDAVALKAEEHSQQHRKIDGDFSKTIRMKANATASGPSGRAGDVAAGLDQQRRDADSWMPEQ